MGPLSRQSSHPLHRGVIYAIVGTFLFASKSILAKWVYQLGGDATELLTLRLLYSAPFYAFVGWTAIRKINLSKKEQPSRWMFKAAMLGFFGYYLAAYLDLAGLEFISAQLERLTLFTYPAITALLAWRFLNEAITWRTIASITLCFVGIAVMYGQEMSWEKPNGHAPQTLVGVGLVMGAALSYSVYVVLSKPLMQAVGTSGFTSIAMLGSGAFVAVHFLLTRSPANLIELDGRIHGYALILAIGCTVIPSYLINAAIVHIGASRTSIIGTAGPVLTMVLAIVVLNEPSTLWHFVGMALAIVGVSIISIPMRESTRSVHLSKKA